MAQHPFNLPPLFPLTAPNGFGVLPAASAPPPAGLPVAGEPPPPPSQVLAQDPALLNNALIQLGAALMQPIQPGQSAAGAAGQAIFGALDDLEKKKSEREAAAFQREKFNLDTRRVDIAERQGDEELRLKERELDLRMKQIQAELAAARAKAGGDPVRASIDIFKAVSDMVNSMAEFDPEGMPIEDRILAITSMYNAQAGPLNLPLRTISDAEADSIITRIAQLMLKGETDPVAVQQANARLAKLESVYPGRPLGEMVLQRVEQLREAQPQQAPGTVDLPTRGGLRAEDIVSGGSAEDFLAARAKEAEEARLASRARMAITTQFDRLNEDPRLGDPASGVPTTLTPEDAVQYMQQIRDFLAANGKDLTARQRKLLTARFEQAAQIAQRGR